MTVDAYKKVFAENLAFYLDRNNMTQAELARRLNVSESTITYWLQGKKSPRMGKVDQICSIFGILRSDLMDRKTNNSESSEYYINPETRKIAQEIYQDPDLHMLFDAARNASSDDLRAVQMMLKALKAKEKNSEN